MYHRYSKRARTSSQAGDAAGILAALRLGADPRCVVELENAEEGFRPGMSLWDLLILQ